jgi:hypothetical protein
MGEAKEDSKFGVVECSGLLLLADALGVRLALSDNASDRLPPPPPPPPPHSSTADGAEMRPPDIDRECMEKKC